MGDTGLLPLINAGINGKKKPMTMPIIAGVLELDELEISLLSRLSIHCSSSARACSSSVTDSHRKENRNRRKEHQ